MVVDQHDKEMLLFEKQMTDKLEKIFEKHDLEIIDPAEYDDLEASDMEAYPQFTEDELKSPLTRMRAKNSDLT